MLTCSRFTVKATGGRSSRDIPDGRLSFCSGVSSAPDDSSFQITIYGGYKLSNAAATNKVHVLILPTFQWLDVTPSDQSLGDRNWGRQSHRCEMWNDAQMFVLGGIIQGNNQRNNSQVNAGACNSTHPPLLVLDTTTFQWMEEFNPNRSYSQPKVVYDLIGGDWRGFNGRTAPEGGFNNSALEDIFATTVRRIDQPTAFAAQNTPDPTAPPTDPNPNEPTDSEKTNVGAIAGGVAGSVVGLCLIGALIWWFLRRRRREDPPEPPRNEMTRFEKPELEARTPSSSARAQGTEDASKFELPDETALPVELPAGHENGSGNDRSVYELEAEQRRVELSSAPISPGARAT
ncbi:hypothetical protein ABW19_dt0203067 [Dactylella cylindrospora]|nr:hypothetical protein ABW19_dt0203067 [Dactylella cylindrospora]